MNSTTHGLRCKILPPPNAGADLIDERVEIYRLFYKPSTPAEEALIRQMATAEVQHGRSSLYLEGHLETQVRNATANFQAARVEHVEDLKTQLQTEPGKASRALKRTALGCRYLIDRWTRLDASLAGPAAAWNAFEQDEAIRLLGCICERPALRFADGDVLDAFRHSMRITGEAPDRDLSEPQEIYDFDTREKARAEFPEGHPATKVGYFARKAEDPERPASLAWMRAMIADQLAWLSGGGGVPSARAGGAGTRRRGGPGDGAGGEGGFDVDAVRADAHVGLQPGVQGVRQGSE